MGGEVVLGAVGVHRDPQPLHEATRGTDVVEVRVREHEGLDVLRATPERAHGVPQRTPHGGQAGVHEGQPVRVLDEVAVHVRVLDEVDAGGDGAGGHDGTSRTVGGSHRRPGEGLGGRFEPPVEHRRTWLR